MLVVSFKVSRAKIIGLFCICLVMAVLIIAGVNRNNNTQTVLSTNIKGSTNEDRVAFITGKGWQISDASPETVDIIIPSDFDNIYEKYNAIQKQQGFDLSKYKGKKVTRYTYVVTNYPTKQDSPVNINLLVYNDVIIGGDVCSTALGGFIHGFAKPAA